jgi:hypothetical protein
MNERVVFCTSYLESDPQRYQNWINYYTKFFEGCGVDLMMVNDGPPIREIDTKNVNFRHFDVRLGRQSVWVFPGWKRSFYHALKWCSGYRRIAHVESDCWITPQGRAEFLRYLEGDGYFTGYCRTYNFPEACLQILNDSTVRQYLVDKYSCEDNWYEDINFEADLSQLRPMYILEGDRIENRDERFSPIYTYLTALPLEDFERFYGSRLLLL